MTANKGEIIKQKVVKLCLITHSDARKQNCFQCSHSGVKEKRSIGGRKVGKNISKI